MMADYPVTATVRRWFCSTPRCHGEMNSTGSARTTPSTNYQHRCSVCSAVRWESAIYPRIIHKDADGREFG